MTPGRVLAGIVGAMVVVAFVTLAFAGDGSTSRQPQAAEDTTTTSTTQPRRATTTTTAEEATTTTAAFDPDVIDVIAEPIGDRRIVALGRNSLRSVHLDTNVVTSLDHDLDIDEGTFPQPVMVATGENVFFLVRSHAYVVPEDLGRKVRDLGDAYVLFGSGTRGRVWVTREGAGGYVLDEITGDGSVTRTSRPLPVDATPLAAVGDAIALGWSDHIDLWDPATGRTRWSSPTDTRLVGAAGTKVVWQRVCSDDSPLCVLHVYDAATRAERTFPIAGVAGNGFDTGYAVSPDGRHLAASSAIFGDRPDSRLSVIDLESGVVVEAPSNQGGRPMWSPDGAWIFIGSLGDIGQPLQSAFRVDGLTLREVTVRMPSPIAVIAAVVV